VSAETLARPVVLVDVPEVLALRQRRQLRRVGGGPLGGLLRLGLQLGEQRVLLGQGLPLLTERLLAGGREGVVGPQDERSGGCGRRARGGALGGGGGPGRRAARRHGRARPAPAPRAAAGRTPWRRGPRRRARPARCSRGAPAVVWRRGCPRCAGSAAARTAAA